ncbi:two-component regulator propeller domain-containing protein [candidate division KSB1 bacterium]
MNKNFFTIPLILFLLIVTGNKDAASQVYTWESVTFLGDVRDAVFLNGKIWASTSGGLFSYDVDNNTFNIYNNTSGLSGNDISSIAVDGSGNIWLGLDDGSLNVMNTDEGTFKRVQIDTDPIEINDIVIDGNSIYLAMDFGISLFLIDKEEVNSNFRVLGNFPVNTQVNSMFLSEGRIWAATERGIASADLASPNLQDPQFWINYTVSEGLPANSVTGFEELNGTIFAGTGNGIARLEGGVFVPDGLQGSWIPSINNINGVLYTGGGYGIYPGVYKRETSGNWIELTPRIFGVNFMFPDNDNKLWAGHSSNGLYYYNESAPGWQNFFPDAPRGNTFEEMVIDRNGRLWAASGQNSSSGVYMFDGNRWQTFTTQTRPDSLSKNATTGIAEDSKGRIWVGTPGKGAMIIEITEDAISVANIDQTGGKLIGADVPDFVIVNRIRKGPDGNIWLVNKFANNGNGIVVVTPEDEYFYFSTNDGLSSTIINDIAFDLFGRFWIGTRENGLDLLDHKNTIGDKTDDTWSRFRTADGLTSNRITALAADKMHGMWIGTEDGINYYIDGFPVQPYYGAIDNYITDIEVDPANNKWFGTQNGLSILSADNFTWSHFTKESGNLIDNNIISIYFDENTGDAYIGTGKGLSIIHTPYRKAADDLSEMGVFPNPFVIDGSVARITIENLVLNSVVKIFSSSGRLVKTLTVENNGVMGSRAYWDGKDKDGYYVSSGVYFIVAGADGRESGRQKVAVIRK